MRHGRLFCLSSAITAMSTSPAFAHPGHPVSTSGLSAGVMHPLFGPDHLLAMIAIGLLSAQIGGRAIWALPGCFLGAMIGGGLWGMAGNGLPAVEYGVAATVVLLGAIVALNRRSSLLVPTALAVVCGLLHGHAHGTEMPSIVNPALYALGFLVATGGLHVVGVVIGSRAIRSVPGTAGLRLVGGAIATAGIVFALAVVGAS